MLNYIFFKYVYGIQIEPTLTENWEGIYLQNLKSYLKFKFK
jgi:hypothetical protein